MNKFVSIYDSEKSKSKKIEIPLFSLPSFFVKRYLIKIHNICLNILDHSRVVYVIHIEDVNCYPRTEVEKLQQMLATILHTNFHDIIVVNTNGKCIT